MRLLRVRQRLTQTELALRAGVSRRTVLLIEAGRLAEARLAAVASVTAALGARLDVRLFWNGPELDRMLDETHAAVAQAVKRRLERWSWIVRVEVSYNRYGERGRIDLLAWHPATRTLLVIEIKTDLVDVQALLGSLDVKARVARHVAEELGWDVRRVVPAIVFLEDRGVRGRLSRVAELFDRYELRGRAALAWLRRPESRPSGIMWFQPTVTRSGAGWDARRVYRSRGRSA